MNYEDCKTEQAFKMEWLRRNKDKFLKLFCIETEETVKGFPDVLGIRESVVLDDKGAEKHKWQTPVFFEFKFTKTGKIKFQPTQPAFYKAHSDMNIWIVAFNRKTGNVHEFYAKELFNNKSAYRLNLKAEVNLNKAEI